jgi:hypothetical protein
MASTQPPTPAAQCAVPAGDGREGLLACDHPTLVAAFASFLATSRALAALTGDGPR